MRFKITVFLLLFFSVAPLFAQSAGQPGGKLLKFSVSDFYMDQSDLSASDMSNTYKKDRDRRLMAIIKVKTKNSDDSVDAYKFNFGSNYHEVVKVDNELWVYVQYGAKRTTIMRSGYETLKDHSLGVTLQSGKVYRMELSAIKEGEKVKKKLLRDPIVLFKPVPVSATKNARIKYRKNTPDAKWATINAFDEEGMANKKLPRGSYVYEVEAEGYRKSDGFLELTEFEGQTYTQEITLHSNNINIEVFAGEDTEIYVDGNKMGVVEWFGKLEDGEHVVEARRDRHRTISRTVQIDNRRLLPVRFPSLEPIVGALSITGSPVGALVAINGEPYDTIPCRIDSLLIGSYTVEITKPDYNPERFSVEIVENEVVEKEVALVQIAKVTISTTPQDATIYINGKEVGKTPYSATFIPGEYELKLTKKKYRDYKGRVMFDPTKTQYDYTLKRIYQKKSCFYMDATACLNGARFGGVNATVGFYAGHVNVEAYGMYGLDSETVYINSPDNTEPFTCNLSPIGFGGRVGGGIILGRRFRITPQAGAGYVVVTGGGITTGAVTASGSVRCEFALARWVGINITPEYSCAVSKNPLYTELEAISPIVKSWGTGLKIRMGLSLSF